MTNPAQVAGGRTDRPQEKLDLKGLWRIIRAGRPRLKLLAAGLVVLLIETAATLCYPVLTRDLIDGLSSEASGLGAILSSTTLQLLVVTLTVSALAAAACRYLLSKVGLDMVATLKKRLVGELLTKPTAYFDERESGEHVSRVNNDAGTISKLVSDAVPNLVSGILMLIGSAIILFILDAKLAAVLFGIIFAAFCLMLPAVAGMAKVTVDQNNSIARLTARLTQLFGNIRLVKAFTAERLEQTRASGEIDNLFGHGLRASRMLCLLQPIVTMAMTFALVSIFLYGGGRIASGSLSVGTLTAFILYIFNIIAPLLQISTFVAQLQASRGAAVSLRGIFEAPSEAGLLSTDVEPFTSEVPLAGDLTFAGLNFAYPECPPTLMIDHLRIDRGSRTAIVGPSGSGKTTLLSLIQRFCDPQHGTISYNGADISRFPLDQWRRRIGYVAQTAPILSGTIRENILYGAPEPVTEQVLEAAAAAANCLGFIRSFEDGFDTLVGEDGVRLSGGQRQRLAIARMFIRDPEILLLDEATSNLDMESEHLVIAALETLMRDRTVILVTHRLATVHGMDRVVVVEGGQIAASGRPEELAAGPGYYGRVVGINSPETSLSTYLPIDAATAA
jgi:ATP-binding cassette subfamily B protein AbcA/BmrA